MPRCTSCRGSWSSRRCSSIEIVGSSRRSCSCAPPIIVALLLSLLAVAARAELASLRRNPRSRSTPPRGRSASRSSSALTPQQQEQGLMYRRALPADAGMLFVFPEDHVATFWMRNTLIPLDMLFIAADGRIADIHERAVPLSEATISFERAGQGRARGQWRHGPAARHQARRCRAQRRLRQRRRLGPRLCCRVGRLSVLDARAHAACRAIAYAASCSAAAGTRPRARLRRRRAIRSASS